MQRKNFEELEYCRAGSGAFRIDHVDNDELMFIWGNDWALIKRNLNSLLACLECNFIFFGLANQALFACYLWVETNTEWILESPFQVSQLT